MKLSYTAVACAVLLSTQATAFSVSQYADQHEIKKHEKLEFLQEARKGHIEKNPKQAKCYLLTLSEIKNRVIYISDAPVRKTGILTMEQFAVTWDHNERVDNMQPNAILHAKLADSKKDVWVNDAITLSNLQYDAAKKTVTYTACPLDKKSAFQEKQLVELSLFIDPFHQWPP